MKDTGTDWARLAAMTEEEKYQNALSDPDNPPLDKDKIHGFALMRDIPGATLLERYENLKRKIYKKLVSIRYDADVLNYFKSKGKGYQSMMNDALRAFMEAELAQKA